MRYLRTCNILYLINGPCVTPADTDVFKTSLGRLKKVTTSYDQTRRLHDIWKKTSDLRRLKNLLFTSSWRSSIYDVWFTTSSGRLVYDVLKTSDLRCLEDVQFTTPWRRLIYDVLKTSDLWRLEDVCKSIDLNKIPYLYTNLNCST